jgi:hypothetical protein
MASFGTRGVQVTISTIRKTTPQATPRLPSLRRRPPLTKGELHSSLRSVPR